ncbi:class I SAM-dependent methyltransferase [Arthrobacter sp. I2-34]|uniref:Class I SAM-dependent methyltransferase n=1 Tax=Arthrobacter hankyongi TaxID=2904801 RepID=A0ABS9LA21_9MICC|nr:class I SAM-dependent methyltransferase [Arthrobacter hankyongi]MCG2623309.1 class I SAM-dependent methyltransferase [Arthrobacter hankyongi]
MAGTALPFRVDPSNTEQVQAWDGDEGDYWAAHAQRFDQSLAYYHPRLMESAGITAGSQVLDIGCGTGQTTRDAARLAGSGSALGLDLSARMLEVARRLAAEAGLANAEFRQADAQVHPFKPASYDCAISRTGTLFFGDPVRAWANIARALRPGGRLAMAAWQAVTGNEWFLEITGALAAGRNLPVPGPEVPGPFSLSDPERVRRLLTAAGFTGPVLEDLRGPMYFGPDADDACRFILGFTGWMLEGLDEAGRARARRDLRARLADHQTEQGVVFGSAMWLITAARAA